MTSSQDYFSRLLPALLLTVVLLLAGTGLAADMQGMNMQHTSTPFQGIKANTGTVTHSYQNGQSVLTLSDDFKVPDTPDPHWQLVDSDGKVYLLDRLVVKGGRTIRSIVVPPFVKDVAKVQIWCSFAEANLGEASFQSPVK